MMNRFFETLFIQLMATVHTPFISNGSTSARQIKAKTSPHLGYCFHNSIQVEPLWDLKVVHVQRLLKSASGIQEQEDRQCQNPVISFKYFLGCYQSGQSGSDKHLHLRGRSRPGRSGGPKQRKTCVTDLKRNQSFYVLSQILMVELEKFHQIMDQPHLFHFCLICNCFRPALNKYFFSPF